MFMKTFCETRLPPLAGAPLRTDPSASVDDAADVTMDRMAFLSYRADRETVDGLLAWSRARGRAVVDLPASAHSEPPTLTLAVFALRDGGRSFHLGNIALDIGGVEVPVGTIVGNEILRIFEGFRTCLATRTVAFASPIEAIRHMRQTRGSDAR